MLIGGDWRLFSQGNLSPFARRLHAHALRMNAKKKLFRGMSLDGQAEQSVRGIILDIATQCQGSIKVPRAKPLGVFHLLCVDNLPKER
jgi:hypothetical protein